MKNTKNLVMAVANDSGNGFSKTYTQFEDGTNSTTVTPSLYANVSGKETIPELGRIDLGELDNNMDVMIKSPALKTASELLVGKAAVDRKSTRLNSSHVSISYAVFCLKKKMSA